MLPLLEGRKKGVLRELFLSRKKAEKKRGNVIQIAFIFLSKGLGSVLG